MPSVCRLTRSATSTRIGMEELREGRNLVTLFFYRSGIASVGVRLAKNKALWGARGKLCKDWLFNLYEYPLAPHGTLFLNRVTLTEAMPDR